ncbi:MAG: hypothetical protein IJH75_05665 [Mogibacterium sp.]|nr:hypothetical protein [Mogibacterium sp.]
MKTVKRSFTFLLTLALTAALVLGMSTACYGESSSFTEECVYNGSSKIESDFDSDSFAATVRNMEPGDDIEYTITYKNATKDTTEWYMRNRVLETLEQSKDPAENGGYTYRLVNIGPDGKETVLFNNSEVGGETVVEDLEGLLQATNATGEYFFVQELGAGQQAKTNLYVYFDGEAEVNDYMDTYGALMVSYAVEKKGEKPDNPPTSRINTGDRNRLYFLITVNACAIVLLILALIFWRRSRKDGEDA